MVNYLLLTAIISVSSPTELNLPSKNTIDAINRKGLQAVERMKTQTEHCGDPFVTPQIVWGVTAPEGSRLCQDMRTKKFRLAFPKPQLVNGEYLNEYIF